MISRQTLHNTAMQSHLSARDKNSWAENKDEFSTTYYKTKILSTAISLAIVNTKITGTAIHFAIICQSNKQERGCLVHFARLANTLLKDEESARDNRILVCNSAKYLQKF